MAHLRNMLFTCEHRGCTKNAVVELISWDNFRIGRFCRSHGKSELVELKKAEAGHE